MKNYDCKPTKEELTTINKTAWAELSADDVLVLPVFVLSQMVPDLIHKNFRFSDAWLKKAENEINSDEGVVIIHEMNGHGLPIGRMFAGKIIDSQNKSIIALAYFLPDSLAADVVMKCDRKLGMALTVYCDYYRCSICGNEYMGEACGGVGEATAGAPLSRHILGEKYNGVICYKVGDIYSDPDKSIHKNVLHSMQIQATWKIQMSYIDRPGLLNEYRGKINQ